MPRLTVAATVPEPVYATTSPASHVRLEPRQPRPAQSPVTRPSGAYTAISIMIVDERFSTLTPRLVTASGSCGSARLTRLFTCTSAVSGSVPIAKNTVSVMSPVADEVLCM